MERVPQQRTQTPSQSGGLESSNSTPEILVAAQQRLEEMDARISEILQASVLVRIVHNQSLKEEINRLYREKRILLEKYPDLKQSVTVH